MLTSAAEGAPCSSSDRMQLAAILAVLKQWKQKSQYARLGKRQKRAELGPGLHKTYHSIGEAVQNLI